MALLLVLVLLLVLLLLLLLVVVVEGEAVGPILTMRTRGGMGESVTYNGEGREGRRRGARRYVDI